MSFMFESSAISIIWEIVIETITEATKIVIQTIEEEFASDENDNNWRNIFNNVALSIEAKTIEMKINESITDRWDFDSDWDFDSRWDSDSDTSAENFLNIDESRDAEILFLSIFLTRDLRSRLTISSREEIEAFVSRLSRKFVMNKKLLTMNNFKKKSLKMKENYEKKWNYYNFIYKFTSLRKI
jgi:hypothetical protein